jgi:hypothetical protein
MSQRSRIGPEAISNLADIKLDLCTKSVRSYLSGSEWLGVSLYSSLTEFVREFYMMTIYAKTKKGMDEMLARKPSIDLALNSVLILVDGVRTAEQIAPLLAAAKAPSDSLSMLHHGGFIEPRVVHVQTQRPAATKEQDQQTRENLLRQTQAKAKADDVQSTAFIEVYTHMVNETKRHLGLRGLGYQFKLERATSMNDLRSIMGPLSEAVAKTQGLQAANDFVRDCDEKIDARQVREASAKLVNEARAIEERRAKLRRVA